jgi:CBS domain-containing protein
VTNHVKDWMSSPVIVIDPDSTVSYALTLMRRRGVHSLVVSIPNENMPTYGIVTSTDVRDKILGANRNPAKTKIREIMSAPVIFARPEWTLQECSRQMQAHGFHHMPVVDEHDDLVGLISATDLFQAAEEIGWGMS